MAIDMDGLNMEKIQSFVDDYRMQDEEEDQSDLLDLYICCQCSVYCVASDIIPGVIPRKVHEAFVQDKQDHPSIDRTGEMAVMVGWYTVIKYVEIYYSCTVHALYISVESSRIICGRVKAV